MKQIAKSGKKVLFVATKKQAKDIVAEKISNVNMPFVTERWSGGMLTNFQTTRKSIRKMATIDKMKSDGSWDTLNKREKLFKTRQREKLEKTFGSISDMTRQPAAVFIVDILKEHIALAEARRLNIPTIVFECQTICFLFRFVSVRVRNMLFFFGSCRFVSEKLFVMRFVSVRARKFVLLFGSCRFVPDNLFLFRFVSVRVRCATRWRTLQSLREVKHQELRLLGRGNYRDFFQGWRWCPLVSREKITIVSPAQQTQLLMFNLPQGLEGAPSGRTPDTNRHKPKKKQIVWHEPTRTEQQNKFSGTNRHETHNKQLF
jgi:hypothetical protein